jgi:hypothetical protein
MDLPAHQSLDAGRRLGLGRRRAGRYGGRGLLDPLTQLGGLLNGGLPGLLAEFAMADGLAVSAEVGTL